MPVGWCCPRCSLVLAPHVAEHRCDPPAAGVTTVAPWQPSPWPTSITVSTPDTWAVTTSAAPHTTGGAYLAAVPDTGGMPPRHDITESVQRNIQIQRERERELAGCRITEGAA